jgi:hypothetical protein
LNTSITEIYIGSTTNFRVRKNKHKTTCNNINHKHYNLHIYNIIRQNGGWENWDMHPIEQIECETIIESRIREQYWIQLKQSSLNSCKAYLSKEEKQKYKKQHHKEDYAKNIDKVKQQSKEYRIENANKLKIKNQQYASDNADKIAQYKKEWYSKNIYRLKQKEQNYYIANRDKIIQYQKEHKAKKKAEALLLIN